MFFKSIYCLLMAKSAAFQSIREILEGQGLEGRFLQDEQEQTNEKIFLLLPINGLDHQYTILHDPKRKMVSVKNAVLKNVNPDDSSQLEGKGPEIDEFASAEQQQQFEKEFMRFQQQIDNKLNLQAEYHLREETLELSVVFYYFEDKKAAFGPQLVHSIKTLAEFGERILLLVRDGIQAGLINANQAMGFLTGSTKKDDGPEEEEKHAA